MRVIAKLTGFYRGARRRPGAEFDMDEADMKKGKDGAPVLPSWVVPATPEVQAELGRADAIEAKRAREAVVASAGPKRGSRPAVKDVDADLTV